MRLTVIILYIVCFGCYVLFTRQPDYFDSERTTGIVVKKPSGSLARFSYGGIDRFAEVPYPFLHKDGETVEVIFEASDPARAKQYGVIGYWITFGELIASIFIVLALYWVATAITKNPTPEALIEELEAGKKKPRKPKYDL